MIRRILITDKVHDLLVNGLQQKGLEVKYQPGMSYKDVCNQVKDYEGLIINSKVICDKNFLQNAQHLDFIGRLGSGLDIIDLPLAEMLGIQIISSPEGNANAVGEHCLGMLLTLLHNIASSHQDVTHLNWSREPNRGKELYQMTVGIIGYGHTGPAFAHKLKGLDVNILVYDKYKPEIAFNCDHMRQVNALDELLTSSDVVSIHLPLTQETKSLVNESFLLKMKTESILINTSRGGIADSQAMLNSLERGHLSGICLDVLENEKPATWSIEQKKMYINLLQRRDVIITPHIAGWTHRSLRHIASILFDKICNFYGV